MNISQQKELLLQEKTRLESELNALGQRGTDGSWIVVPSESDGTLADPIDNADLTEEFEEKVARLNVLEAQYAQMEKALRAIENGSYGVCEVSGEAIPEARLRAYPAATTTAEHSK